MSWNDMAEPSVSGPESEPFVSDSAQDHRLAFYANPRNWPLFYYTAKNMKPRQLAGIAERKVRHAVLPRLPIDFDQRYEQQIPTDLHPHTTPIARNLDTLRECLPASEREDYRQRATAAANGTITFLNRSIDFGNGDTIDWDHDKLDEYPLLWRLKLQSFEPLAWLFLGYEEPADATDIDATFKRWLLSWAADNPIGEAKYLRRSWIPHSVSLRILNWCRYAAWCEEHTDSSPPAEVYRAIYKNALFLANHVEWDVGGNHLIENAAALVMAGVLFNDHNNGWLDSGLDILEHTAQTQFLDDGGHFERSPMYHIYCLTRYLTTIDLLQKSNLDMEGELKCAATNMTTFLRAIRPSDSQIPLLNDSVFEEALPLDVCLSYAESVGIETSKDNKSLNDSGYFWLGTGEDRLLIDGGQVGPAHLSAHSHNDIFTILLCIDGDRFITDTGTFEYAPTERRQHSRSIAAHNTVQVDDTEPIDIGGRYMMGRRITPVVLQRTIDQIEMFEGKYKKKARFGTEYDHHRTVYHDDHWWLIWDQLTMASPNTIRSRLHFHPDVELSTGQERIHLQNQTTGSTCSVYPLNIHNTKHSTSLFFPRFGAEESRALVEFQNEGETISFGYLISKERFSDVDLEIKDGAPVEVLLETESQQLSTPELV